MGFLEDLKNGDIKSIILVILIIFMFHQYWGASQTKFEPQGKAGESNVARSTRCRCKDNKESMADVSNDIKEAVKQVYLADVEAIRNLSEVATKLQAGGYTIPGDLTVKGQIISEKKINGLTLSELNNKIDSVNSSLTGSINSVNSNLTNQVNSINSQLSNKISNNSNISLEDNLNPKFLIATAQGGSTVITSTTSNIPVGFGQLLNLNRKWKISNA